MLNQFISISLDALHATGKSTLTQMLAETFEEVIIFKKKSHNPYLEIQKYVQDALTMQNLINLELLCEQLKQKFEKFEAEIDDANNFALAYDKAAQGQAFLSYFYALGKISISKELDNIAKENNILIDRWQIGCWANQNVPGIYTWREIQRLYQERQVYVPDLQFIISCSDISTIIQRQESRKESHRMSRRSVLSVEENEIAYKAFIEIASQPNANNIYLINNDGGLSEGNIKIQIAQALPAYDAMIETINKAGYKLCAKHKEYWNNDAVIDRILKRQAAEK